MDSPTGIATDLHEKDVAAGRLLGTDRDKKECTGLKELESWKPGTNGLDEDFPADGTPTA
jgi:hypothetical protein